MAQAADVIRIARGEIGYREGFSGGHWNNHQRYSPAVPGLEWSQNQAWCATFVSWCARQAGAGSLFPVTASVWTAYNWFRSRGRYSAYPAIGAQVIYGRSANSHTGIVVAYDANTITTVEGNTSVTGSAEGDGVYLKRRNRRDAYVHGYGLPQYAEGVTTADPALKGKRGFVYKTAASGPASSGSHAGSGTGKTVVVKAGQTLGKIAASAGVSLAALLAINPQVKNPDVIHPGDRITVPEKGTQPPAKAKPVVSLAHIRAAAVRDPDRGPGGTTYPSDVRPVESALHAEGLLDSKWCDGSFGSMTRIAYANWQQRTGVGGPPDGIPGIASLRLLGNKHGFTVEG
ncbi:CHAP domain-containing protein [Streptomyces noursei]|uniref:LysM peptidoglycan-binding domain-containing protein n=1 Tax=Streptomyces noursei TaxID=1971 RepID=UPI00081CDB84|nr:LysM domain-containing protein [Streptomyces noursei ATCC 11455]MCZ0996327.1 CHAP domain-containing protein [Streptomyces noursei]